MKLAAQEIMGMAKLAGFDENAAKNATAIALAESDGDTEALGDAGVSKGLWQIDTRWHPEWFDAQLFNATVNACAAYQIYFKAGKCFMPCSTFKSGRYMDFLNEVQS